jgi:hypothetical protein
LQPEQSADKPVSTCAVPVDKPGIGRDHYDYEGDPERKATIHITAAAASARLR